MPIRRENQLRCKICGATFPSNFGYCPYCKRAKDEEERKRLEEAETQPGKSDEHICLGCAHTEVCALSRHTAELYGLSGWEARIAECNRFVPMFAEGEIDEEADTDETGLLDSRRD